MIRPALITTAVLGGLMVLGHFDAQDEIDTKRSALIEEIERRLRTTTTLDLLFTLRWTLM